LRDLRMPDFLDYEVKTLAPGATTAEATRVMGSFLRDIMKLNLEARNLRFSVRTRTTQTVGRMCSKSRTVANGGDIARRRPPRSRWPGDGSLSEHQCQGWLAHLSLLGQSSAAEADQHKIGVRRSSLREAMQAKVRFGGWSDSGRGLGAVRAELGEQEFLSFVWRGVATEDHDASSVVGKWTSSICMALSCSKTERGVSPGALSRSL